MSKTFSTNPKFNFEVKQGHSNCFRTIFEKQNCAPLGSRSGREICSDFCRGTLQSLNPRFRGEIQQTLCLRRIKDGERTSTSSRGELGARSPDLGEGRGFYERLAKICLSGEKLVFTLKIFELFEDVGRSVHFV